MKNQTLEEIIGLGLAQHGMSVSVAESCTGGLLGGRLTAVSGSSNYFRGGIIAYANEVKSAELGVSDGVLAREGAVCDEVAVQMAQEVRRRFRTDVGIAITGIAGPGGGSPGKPIGTVHIAVALGNEHTVERFVFEGDRDRVREMSCDAALGMLKHSLDRI